MVEFQADVGVDIGMTAEVDLLLSLLAFDRISFSFALWTLLCIHGDCGFVRIPSILDL